MILLPLVGRFPNRNVLAASQFLTFRLGDSIDVVWTSRQHISYQLNLMHMNYNNTSVYDNPKDSSLCNIFILKNIDTNIYILDSKKIKYVIGNTKHHLF